MDLTDRTVWQAATGESGRRYEDLCLLHNAIFMGPGERGSPDEEPAGFEKYGKYENRMRWLYEDMKQGDVVILRTAPSSAVAVGFVESKQGEFRELFADVDGWSLQHSRRVHWVHVPDEPKSFGQRTFGGTLTKVRVDRVHDWLESLRISEDMVQKKLPPLPEAGAELSVEELGDGLFEAGLPSEYVNDLVNRLESIRRVARWYDQLEDSAGRPSEHETIAYLVVPLLMALGWSEQQVAVEWNHIDVAFFSRMPPRDSTLQKVMEVKRLKRAIRKPVGQARRYADKPKRDSCRCLITTNGIRYAVFSQNNDGFPSLPNAYLNLLNMRDSYPVLGDECGGAVEAMLELSRL